MIQAQLEKLLREANLHQHRLSRAANKMAEFMPLTSERYTLLTEDEIEHIDQFLFRFAKLQDVIGQRLFKTLLIYLQEGDVGSWPFIDVLNRLEKIGVLEDKAIWLELRQIRNHIAHQYEENIDDIVKSLNTIYTKYQQLTAILSRIKQMLP